MIFIWLLFPAIVLHRRKGPDHNYGHKLISFVENGNYHQKIALQDGSLEAIKFQLKNPMLKNQSQITAKLFLNNNQVALLSTSGLSVGDPSWIPFKFKRIEVDPKDDLYLVLETDNNNPESLQIYTDNDTILHETFYISSGLSESLKIRLSEIVNIFSEINKFALVGYISLVLLLNILLFKINK